MQNPIFTGPADLENFAATCCDALLTTEPHQFHFPPDCSIANWSKDAIKSRNKNLLAALRNNGNVYGLFIKDRTDGAKWQIQYIGERKSDGLRTRITDHLICKNEKTGSKLAHIKEAVSNGKDVGIGFIKVMPESLRLFVEETLIAKNKNHLPWNIHG